MYDDEIRSFVEAVEPDLSYKGTEGSMAMLVESAQNMIALEDFIHTDTYQEGVVGDVAGAVWNKIKKFFALIVNLIKKIIAKIKSFFIALRRKITMAAATAMKKIGEFVQKHTDMNKTVKDAIAYRGLNVVATKKFIDNINGWAKQNDQKLEHVVNETLEATLKAKGKVVELKREDMLNDNCKAILEGSDYKTFIEKAKESLIEEKELVPSNKAFEEIYKSELLKNLDAAYNAIIKAKAVKLATSSKLEKSITTAVKQVKLSKAEFKAGLGYGDTPEEKEELNARYKETKGVVDERQHRDYNASEQAKLNKAVSKMLSNINVDVAAHNTVTTMASQAISSVLLSVYKSALGATLRGLKARAKKVVTKESANESVVIL